MLPSDSLRTIVLCVLCLSGLTAAAQMQSPGPIAGSLTVQTGAASNFAVPLADFGGAQQQDKVSFRLTNLWRGEDSMTFWGWQTVDGEGTMNWELNATYRLPIARLGRGTLFVASGIRRWHLPSVAATNDWVSDNTAIYERTGKVPISLEADWKTVLASNKEVAMGTFMELTAETTMALKKSSSYSVWLRHGPCYIYGMGMYGIAGSREFRYSATLALKYRGYTFEVLGRPQIALQSGLDSRTYWSVTISHALRLFGSR